MKKILVTVAQCILFLLVFLAGSLANSLHLRWFVAHPTPTSTHYFVPDGLIFATVLYLVFLLFAVVRKRLSTSARYSTIAFVVAILLGFLSKFGSVTHDLYQ